MASNGIAGYKGIFALSTANGSTVRDLAEVRNFTIDVTMGEIDVTTHDSSGYRDVIAGIVAWSGTAEYLNVQTSTYHKAVIDGLLNKAQIDAEFYPTGSSGDGYFSGDCFITNWTLGAPNEDALAVNISFVGTGTLTRTSSA